VITHLQDAERLGWIKKKKRSLSGKEWAANEYLASWPEGVKEVHPINMSQVKEIHLRGERGSHGGVKEVHMNSPSELSKEQSILVKTKKGKAHAYSCPSVGVALEDLESIPADLHELAIKRELSPEYVHGEWAKFRNHHISTRSKHTRIDLCWDTWCRNNAKWGSGGGKIPPGSSRQGGTPRYDHVASAKRGVLAELGGISAEKLGGDSTTSGDTPHPFGSGDEKVQAEFVDIEKIHDTLPF
jgi:hypothetical protein